MGGKNLLVFFEAEGKDGFHFKGREEFLQLYEGKELERIIYETIARRVWEQWLYEKERKEQTRLELKKRFSFLKVKKGKTKIPESYWLKEILDHGQEGAKE